MIKSIVFDVGDVLADFCYEDYMRNLGFREVLVRFFTEHIVLTDFWHQMDMGEKSIADGRREFIELYPQYIDEINLFWDRVEEIVEEYDYSEDLVKDLKNQGYGIYILSNYPKELAEMQWPKFKFLKYADGKIISAYEHLTKPDEKIFRLLEERFDIDLNECLFIDDRQINVDAAERLGMTTILFKGYNDLNAKLNKLGIRLY